MAFLALGPAAERFLRTAAAAGTARLDSKLGAIVALELAWGRAALLPALERAVTFHRFTAADVRAILAAGPGGPPPTPPGSGLSLAHLPVPEVPTRALSAYALEALQCNEYAHAAPARARPGGWAAPAQARAHPQPGAGGLADGQDAALAPRGGPAHLGRGRNRRAHRRHRAAPPAPGPFPGSQDPGGVPPGPV